MTTKRKIELFSAGCPACESTADLVKKIACLSCEVSILDMNKPEIALRASSLGIQTVPTLVVDGKLLDCCTVSGLDETVLRRVGIGQA